MLKLKLQYFGHMMRKADTLEKTLMLELIEGKGEGIGRRWDGWIPSLSQWTWIWTIFRRQWGTEVSAAATAAKSFQSCLTLCDPIDGSPPDSPVPGILQARTLEWVVISFSNAWKWKVKVKLLSHVRLLATSWTAPTRFLQHGIFQARVLEWVAIVWHATVHEIAKSQTWLRGWTTTLQSL